MGYRVSLKESNLKFKKENNENILKSLKEFAGNVKRLMWDDKDSILQAEYIEECFAELRYPLAENGEFYDIDEFTGDKLGDEEKIFNSIAKYVEKGSYLEFVNENGDVFRLVFDGEKCEYKYPKIVWY